MVAPRVAAAASLLLLARAAGATTPAAAHPLHTTLTEVTVDSAKHTVRAVVRVFAEDIGAALARRAGARKPAAALGDAEATEYVLSELVLVVDDRSLRPVALRSCGVKRSGVVHS